MLQRSLTCGDILLLGIYMGSRSKRGTLMSICNQIVLLKLEDKETIIGKKTALYLISVDSLMPSKIVFGDSLLASTRAD